MLASDLAVHNSFHQTTGPITWFESFPSVDRVSLESLARVDKLLPEGIAGPIEPAVGEWIVQLTDTAAKSLRTLGQGNAILNQTYGDFTIISGLGIEGLLLVRGRGATKSVLESSLSHNESIQSFSLNQLIQGQSTTPNDPEFVAGLMPGLEKIDATNAWDVSRGSSSTVVGVVDGGIDPTHPDLYLNIWINQGELPTKYLDDVGPKLTDIDGDGLITFYDLNNVTRATTAPYSLTFNGYANGPNASIVVDKNNNGRIDAIDLLDDPNWADGFDTDNNGFFDDFFGVNFRVGSGDPFAANNPSDELGHGTHVAGTIGAIGGNATGVVGVNWQTSLMSLRILDNNNQGDSGAAIRAINYAREMRERYRIEPNGRVSQGANVRVLNNSWGQPGGYEVSLETAIQDSTDAGILFVAASGNGNFLGQGVDNDRTHFYPASYDTVLAVAASDSSDRPASFSNYGTVSVDLFAPGIGIRSTLPGGGIGSANGTSMASPHVAGTAALIWSAFPEATVAEIQSALLSTVDPIANGLQFVSTGGRLNASKAINADVFAPSARLVAKQNITTAGGTSTEFTIEYSHRSGIATSSIGDDDLIVTRQWGPADRLVATLKANSITTTATTARATYIVTAPGGTWDPLDFGDYQIETASGKVAAAGSIKSTEQRLVGSFNVRILDASVIYVDSSSDSLNSGSLRSAIELANKALPTKQLIILNRGQYGIDIRAVIAPDSSFNGSLTNLGIVNPGGWSDSSTGDFDIQGNISIVGDSSETTILDANRLDRAFKVYAGASLSLSRITLKNGIAPTSQGGGAILSLGETNLDQVILRDNTTFDTSLRIPGRGGAIAAWAGDMNLNQAWITRNRSNFGGGLHYSGEAKGKILASTIDGNIGGGLHSHSDKSVIISNSTFSSNEGGLGDVFNGKNDGLSLGNSNFILTRPTISMSSSGTIFAFDFSAFGNSTSQFESREIYVNDQSNNNTNRTSVSFEGNVRIDGSSSQASLSSDGQFLAFTSTASNLVRNDTNGVSDVFLLDRSSNHIERISVGLSGEELEDRSDGPTFSNDGRFIVFATNGATNGTFVFDRTNNTVERVGDFSFEHGISANGRFVSLKTFGTYLPSDTNNNVDVYVYDRSDKSYQLASANVISNTQNGQVFGASISNDGRFTAFHSSADGQVYVYDRISNTTERASVRFDGGGVPQHLNEVPMISGDGNFVVFDSRANDLVPNDNNTVSEIFIFNRNTRTTARITNQGLPLNGDSLDPIISPDGRYVAFSTFASNASLGDNDGEIDFVVYDRQTDTIRPVTQTPTNSTIEVSQSTFANTRSGTYSISGQVNVADSLFANSTSLFDFDVRSVTTVNSIMSTVANAGQIGPLARVNNLPPTHSLLSNNPAIDHGDARFNGTRDQVGAIRTVADIGAREAIGGTISGKIFADLDGQTDFDSTEPGVPDVVVRAKRNDLESANSTITLTDASGNFSFSNLSPGEYQISYETPNNFQPIRTKLTMLAPASVVPSGGTSQPGLNRSGNLITFNSNSQNLLPSGVIGGFSKSFAFLYNISTASTEFVGENTYERSQLSDDERYIAFCSRENLTKPTSTNSYAKIFLYDRQLKSFELISTGLGNAEVNGDSQWVSSSRDAKYLVFSSNASNLVAGENNNHEDIFLYDRSKRQIKRITNGTLGEADGDSYLTSISSDGRYTAYTSSATNLIANDNNGKSDIFLYDQIANTTKRISVEQGVEGIDHSFSPSISGNGQFVAFESRASNFGSNQSPDTDIFVANLQTGALEQISRQTSGTFKISNSQASMSDDGRFVVYHSTIRSGSVLRDDVIVYDRLLSRLARVSQTENGSSGNDNSDFASISGDGRLIAFQSKASNFSSNDNNGLADVFFVENPLIEPGVSQSILAGDIVAGLHIGVSSNPGQVSGRLFEDNLVNNLTFDPGEPPLSGITVFMDTNRNGEFDSGESSVLTNNQGMFEFADLPSLRGYTLSVLIPSGYVGLNSSGESSFAKTLYLPAGGMIPDQDFAFSKVLSTGQSNDSSVSGRLYDDRNGNNKFDAGDVPIVNREVYLDASNFGVRDSNEPRVVTDANGFYSIDGLSSRTVAVTTTLDETLVHVSPLGSQFNLQRFPLFVGITPFANPLAIASSDFNSDDFSDVAVVLAEANKLSIRLNDKKGGFLPDTIDIDLGKDGVGPTSIVIGQFDNDPKLDAALTAKFSSKVIVLLNFNPTTKTFASQSAVTVGLQPSDIVAGQFGGDSKLDLVIVNQGSASVKGDSTVQVLTNNGSGVFTAGPPVPTGGDDSISLTAAKFAGDASLDVAVVHAAPANALTPNGGVTILVGNGAGGMALQSTFYQTGALPIDSSTADFNGDGRADLAVANFSSNSISILLGQSNGVFRVQSSILGTASGAFDIAVGDIDGDGDMDVIASNLIDRNISIFRNIGVDATSGDVRFEPLENVGLGQFAQAQRMPLVVGNFDNDTSGPGGKSTLDIVTIPSETDTLHVLKNKLVNGTHRVLLTGTNKVTNMDFIIKSSVLPPSFDDIASPAAITEDSAQQTIQIGGIKKGRATGPALRFSATSSNPSLVASPSISFVDGSVNASIRYTALPNANGISVITVRATDAGANQIFDDGDDGIFERSFTVTVLAVNDAPSMTTPSELAVPQKAGPKTVSNFVTGISTGGGSDEQNQVLSAFAVTADANFFVVQPSISSTGTLSFTPSPNKSGNVFVSVKLNDNGGVSNGGVDATTNIFVINILPVNDPPSFQLTGSTSLQAVTGPNTLIGFATGFAPGGGEDELSQVVSDYLVSVDSPGLFAVLPSISNDGTLRFTPATDRNGIATVAVRVRDNGGTLNGGVDLSSSQNFSITVGTAQSLTLNATELGPHEIAIRNGLLVVTASGATIRSVPVAELTKVTTIDSSGAKLFEVVLPASNLLGMVRFTGVSNPIQLIAERSAIDLSILTSDKLFGIGLVDLRSVGANSLAFQASNINALNSSKTLRILMDHEDSLSAAGNWRAQTGRLENGTWVQPFTNAGAKIEVISETAWQNKVNRFDIDGDQAVSPLDVLVLVNLINANTFPNGQLPSRGSSLSDGFFDPDGDNTLGPLDALTLINEINRGGGAGSEGEGYVQPQWIDRFMSTDLDDIISGRKSKNRAL